MVVLLNPLGILGVWPSELAVACSQIWDKKDVKLQLQVRLKNIILISLFVHLFKDTWFYVKYVD